MIDASSSASGPAGVDSVERARRRDHEPQLQGARRRRDVRPPDRRQRHGAARDRPRASSTRRRWPRPRLGIGPEVVAFVEPEGYLVTRFVEGEVGAGRRSAEAAALLRRLHDGAADPRAVRRLPRRRGLRGDRAAARRRAPACVAPRRRSPTGSSAAAARRPLVPVPQRPARGELHPRRRAALDRRLGVRGHGRPRLRPRQLRRQQRPRRGRRRARCSPPTAAATPTAHVLMRFMSDFREAMWGVVQQAVVGARLRLRRLRRRALRPAGADGRRAPLPPRARAERTPRTRCLAPDLARKASEAHASCRARTRGRRGRRTASFASPVTLS